MKDKEKDFHDSKQILDLRDSMVVGGREFILSTIMLDQVKIIHGKKYWFETYLVEMYKNTVATVKIMGHYTSAHEAVTSHKLISSCLGYLLSFANKENEEVKINQKEDLEQELGAEEAPIPGKNESNKAKALDILKKVV